MLKITFYLVVCLILFGFVKCNHLSTTNVQAIHAIADGPIIDIYIGGLLLKSGVQYGSFSSYVPFVPGTYQIDITMTGVSPSSGTLISKSLNFVGGDYVTLAAIGSIANQDDYPFDIIMETDTIVIPDDRAILRTMYLSATNTAIEVSDDATNQKLWVNITYPHTGEPEYLTLSANVPYIIEINQFNTPSFPLAGPTLVNLPRNTANTIYVIGIEGSESSPLTIVYHQDFITGQISVTPTITRTGTPTPSKSRTPTVSVSNSPTRSFNTSATTTPSLTSTKSLTPLNTRSPFRTHFQDDDDGDFTKSATPMLASPFVSRSAFRTIVPASPSPSPSGRGQVFASPVSSGDEVPFPSPFLSRTPFRTVVVDDYFTGSDFGSPSSTSSSLLPLSLITIFISSIIAIF